ncbi:MAG TPA: Rpn family recombination-promoting nuclease/putative transposase [Arachidicoccus sp.]
MNTDNKLQIGKYIDPLTDFGFKYLFGAEPNKDLLIDFLNALFNGAKTITDLTYIKNEINGPQKDMRRSVFDLLCTGTDGEKFILEMQRARQEYFKDRTVFYTSTLIHEQAVKGKDWEYALNEVYLVAIMDFSFDDSQEDLYLHRIGLRHEVTCDLFYEKLGYIFVELPKFKKQEADLSTDLDRWLYILKNMTKFDKIPVILTKRIFEKIFRISEVANLKKEDYMEYEKAILDRWAEKGVIDYASKEGEVKGEIKNQKATVLRMLKNSKLSVQKIANFAGVDESFVLDVKKDNNIA